MSSSAPNLLLEELGIFVSSDDDPEWNAADFHMLAHDQNVRNSFSSDSLSNSPSDSGDSGFSTEPSSTFHVNVADYQYDQSLESPFDILPVSPASVSKMEDYLMLHGDSHSTGDASSSSCGVQNSRNPGLCSDSSYVDNIEDEYKTKLEKMVKNRQSAHLSRKRKKEYLETIEAQLKSALVDNDRLKRENLHLKRTLNDLQSQNQRLKENISELSMNNTGINSDDSEKLRGKRFRILSADRKTKSPTKGGAYLCVTLLLFTLYFGPSWNFFGIQRSIESEYKSVNISPIDEENLNLNQILRHQKTHRDQGEVSSQNYSNSTVHNSRNKRLADRNSGCGAKNGSVHSYVNETETLRLLQEINTWFVQHSDQKFDDRKRFRAKGKTDEGQKLDKRLFADYFDGSSAIDDLANNFDDDLRHKRHNNLFLQQRKHYARFRKLFADFADNSKKFPARGDSSYTKNLNQMSKAHVKRIRRLKQLKEVLNYSNNTMHILPEGYLVLPSKSFNGTTSLKISLLMTVSANESSAMSSQDADFLSMMQIECEVVNLIHLPKIGIADQLKHRSGAKIRNFEKARSIMENSEQNERNVTDNFVKNRTMNESRRL